MARVDKIKEILSLGGCERAGERAQEIEELFSGAPTKVAVGDVLYGFCDGAFGRDSYGDKTVIAIGVVDTDEFLPIEWAVVATKGDGPEFAAGVDLLSELHKHTTRGDR